MLNRWALKGYALTMCASWLIANHYPPWLTFHSDILAATAAGLLAVAALDLHTGGIGLPAPAVFFGALACVPILQVIAGKIVFAGDGWVATLYLLCAAWSVMWSAGLTKRFAADWVECFATVLLAGALANCVIAMIQLWHGEAGFLSLYLIAVRPGSAPFGNLGQPNQLASLLGLGLAGLSFLYERKRIRSSWGLLAAALLTFTMVMTQSRTPLLLFAFAAFWLFGFRTRVGLRLRPSVIGLLAGSWGLLFLVWPSILRTMGMPVLASVSSRLEAGPRMAIWPQLWDAILLQPWTGFGWNQVSEASVSTVADHAKSRFTEHSHNLFLDLALWNGLPLALVMTGLALWWLIRIVPRIRSTKGAFGMLVVILLLAHSMVEYPLDYLYFLVPFAMAVGIVATDSGSQDIVTLPRRAGTVLVLAFAALISWVAVDYWRVEEAFRDMRFAVARIGKSIPLNPPPILATQFTQLAAFHHFMLSTPHAGMSKADVRGTKEVAQRFAYAPSLYRYALVQALNGDPGGAKLTLLQLRKFYGPELYGSAKAEIAEMAQSTYPVLRELNLP